MARICSRRCYRTHNFSFRRELMDRDLDFEQELANMIVSIKEIQHENKNQQTQKQLQDAIHRLHTRTKEIYAHLTGWQTVQVARHKNRPYAADYLDLMCDDFIELHGDRAFGDDHAILAGLGNLAGNTVMFICQQKGRSTKEKQYHNYGMPHPEGYRKAYRLMRLAEKFCVPLVCLIDTPGAFPGLEDEEHGQSGAIAENLLLMSRLRVPIVSVVIGEGGSGGALALSVADRLLMLEHSVYTVAAPEAAASILWRDNAFAPQAAEAMRISARELLGTHIVDELVTEPIGGAHHNHP